MSAFIYVYIKHRGTKHANFKALFYKINKKRKKIHNLEIMNLFFH